DCVVAPTSPVYAASPGPGGDVDHTLLSGFPGRASGQLDGQDGARQVKDGTHVEVEHGVDLLGDLLDEVSAFATSCVVDEQVDRCGVPATDLPQTRGHLRDTFWRGQIGGQGLHVHTAPRGDALCEFFQGFGAASDQDQCVTAQAELVRVLLTDARRGAGDQGGPTVGGGCRSALAHDLRVDRTGTAPFEVLVGGLLRWGVPVPEVILAIKCVTCGCSKD